MYFHDFCYLGKEEELIGVEMTVIKDLSQKLQENDSSTCMYKVAYICF